MLHSYDTYGADAVLYRFNLHTRPAVDAPTLIAANMQNQASLMTWHSEHR